MPILERYASQHVQFGSHVRGHPMTLSLRDLVSTPELALRLLAEGPGVDRAVTWVHVSELRDPTPFLSGGELLLTTGLTIDAGLDLDAYVRRLAAAAVVAAAEYASVTRTFTAQQALTKAALAASGPDRLVRLLAQQVLGWVVLLDPSGAPIAAHPENARTKVHVLAEEMAVLAAHRGTVSSSFPLGGDTVSLQSVGAGTRGRAFLAVGRPGTLTAADRHLVNAAVMLLTIRMEQTSTKDAGLGLLRSAVLRLFLSG